MDPNDPALKCPTEDDDDEGYGVEGLNDEGLLARDLGYFEDRLLLFLDSIKF